MTIRSINKLRPGDVATLADGSHSDGSGLYLWVHDGGRLRSWIFRYSVKGRVREMGLGAAAAVPLKQARAKRDELRALIDQGLDPLAERRRRQAEQDAKRTFAEAVEMTLEQKRPGWKGTSTLAAWTRTLTVEAKALAARPIDEITQDEVERVLAPIWEAGLRTEGRPRKGGLVAAQLALTRIATVFDYAKAKGYRKGDNPASWSVFKFIMPSRPYDAAKHHPMVEWRDAPAVMARLRASPTMSSLALEFTILTGTRISETVKAEWDEIDFERRLWTIPGARTKRSVEHAVPLSGRATAILTALHQHRASPGSRIVFRGGLDGRGGPINRATVYDQAQRISGGRASIHGFRATLRSWMADHSVPFETAEAVLAHSKGGVVAAYQRSQLIELRRPIMERWAQFLSGEEPATAEVIPLAARRA